MSEPELLPPRPPDPAVATLYRAALSVATQEEQLIWTRYAGFLVLNGFLLNASPEIPRLLQTTPPGGGLSNPTSPEVILVIGILGLLVNAVWHLLNFDGWYQHNRWFHVAANVSPAIQAFSLPTEWARKVILRPRGRIYVLAQLVPAGFSLAAAAAIFISLRRIVPSEGLAVIVAGCFWLITALVIALIEVRTRMDAAGMPM